MKSHSANNGRYEMNTIATDIAIIGAGTAGLSALKEITRSDREWRLIESGKHGTMCAQTGCMPSKLLIAGADVMHAINEAHLFGIEVTNNNIDTSKVLNRVRSERDRFVSSVNEYIDNLPNKNIISGHAQFIDDNTIRVGNHTTIKADVFIIATGSRASIPPPFDSIQSNRILLNDDIFELKTLPKSLAVIGTGNIGIELGQALSRLDVDVVFFDQSSEIANSVDPNVLEIVYKTFRHEMEINTNVEITMVEDFSDTLSIHWKDASHNSHKEVFENILIATGRKSTIDTINLEALGIEQENFNNLWNSNTTQLGNLPIFIAGDANNFRPLLHEASNEGKIAGKNALAYPNVVEYSRYTPLSITFTDPQIAQVGEVFSNIDFSQVEIGQSLFDDQGRARIMNKNKGIIRLYGCKNTGVLIAAELFTPHAEHMAHLLSWSIQQKLTVQNLLKMPIYHPVLEEGLRSALAELMEKLNL